MPTPLRSNFDYLPPADVDTSRIKPGMRVRVPFGQRDVIGIVLALENESAVPAERLKDAIALLDETPALPDTLLRLYRWAARYYHHPIGQVLQASLPKAVREGRSLSLPSLRYWQASASASLDDPRLRRAGRQREILQHLLQAGPCSVDSLKTILPGARAPLKALADKGLALCREESLPPEASIPGSLSRAHPLNSQQAEAVRTIESCLGGFHCLLLDGVTGSGKTEVYLQSIASVLARGEQVLVLVPEIGLTPQTIARFRQRFAVPLVALHSGLSDGERFSAWLRARDGSAQLIIGTRSALFTPLAKPGLIIVDEEHDGSFKQQEGFRYSARDMAVCRARFEQVPVVLGSATPSLESLQNALSGRYHHLHLPERAGQAEAPDYRVIDLRGEALQDGFSQSSLEAIQRTLSAGRQAMVFLNRRGFAPMLQCQHCGWIATCQRCNMSYTLHQHPPGLQCHHCETQGPLPRHCPDCRQGGLQAVGLGTERSEQSLRQHFPDALILRADRDATRRRDALNELLAQVNRGEPCILVGTQMLAKGHHFPNVTLVVIMDADSGLFSASYRGQELFGQLLTQVAGRAGRAEHRGEVLIQTYHKDHPGLRLLLGQGYGAFARSLLLERQTQALPPFAHQVLLRAESTQWQAPADFLQAARSALAIQSSELQVLGPLPAPLEKRAGRYRFQLLLSASERPPLHLALHHLLPSLDALPLGRRVRWSVDIDPQDFT